MVRAIVFDYKTHSKHFKNIYKNNFQVVIVSVCTGFTLNISATHMARNKRTEHSLC